MSKERIVNITGMCGLSLVALGLLMISPAWACVIVGGLLLTGAVVGAFI